MSPIAAEIQRGQTDSSMVTIFQLDGKKAQIPNVKYPRTTLVKVLKRTRLARELAGVMHTVSISKIMSNICTDSRG